MGCGVTRRHGDIQLSIISITVEADAVSPDDFPQGKHIKIKELTLGEPNTEL